MALELTNPTIWHLPGGGTIEWEIANPERLPYAQKDAIKAVLRKIEGNKYDYEDNPNAG